MYGGQFAFQNRLGLYLEGYLRLKIDWASLYNHVSNLQKGFTETRFEDVDLSF